MDDIVDISLNKNYSISKYGNIIDKRTCRQRNIRYNFKGYGKVNLDGKDYSVHRLVALAFVPNPNPKKYNIINHIDGNPSNNRWDNLEWCTVAHNNKHALWTGLWSEEHAFKCKVRDYYTGEVKEFPSVGEAKRFMGVHKATDLSRLNNVWFGKLWKDRYEFRLNTSNIPWFYETHKEKILSRYRVTFTFPDNTTEEYFRREDICLRFNLGSPRNDPNVTMDKVLDHVSKKYPHVIIEVEDAMNRDRIQGKINRPKLRNREIIGFNIKTNKKYIFGSLTKTASLTGVTRVRIMKYIGTFRLIDDTWYFCDLNDKQYIKTLKERYLK